MKKCLCYGTYAKVLRQCGFVKQIELHRELMKPVMGENNFSVDDAHASNLFRCKNPIPREERRNLNNADPLELREVIAKIAHQCLKANMLNSAVAAICDIILEDEDIPSDTVIDCIGGIQKSDLNQPLEVNVFDFLTGTFIYAVVNPENDSDVASDFVGKITKAYIADTSARFKEKGFTITKDDATRRKTQDGEPVLTPSVIKIGDDSWNWQFIRYWAADLQKTEDGFFVSKNRTTLIIRNDHYEIAGAKTILTLEPNSRYDFCVEIRMTDFERYPSDIIKYPAQSGGAFPFFDSFSEEAGKILKLGPRKVTTSEWQEARWPVQTDDTQLYELDLRNGILGNACKGTAWFRNLSYVKVQGE